MPLSQPHPQSGSICALEMGDGRVKLFYVLCQENVLFIRSMSNLMTPFGFFSGATVTTDIEQSSSMVPTELLSTMSFLPTTPATTYAPTSSSAALTTIAITEEPSTAVSTQAPTSVSTMAATEKSTSIEDTTTIGLITTEKSFIASTSISNLTTIPTPTTPHATTKTSESLMSTTQIPSKTTELDSNATSAPSMDVIISLSYECFMFLTTRLKVIFFV